MKLNAKIKNVTIEIICLLYILLFVYAAVSKLLDFENFSVQIGQSPLLSAFAGFLYWLVPLLEIGIAVLLVLPALRVKGLIAALIMMVLFTTYIIIILNFSSFIPCSCGGVLEKLGWTEHLVFNLFFVLLALIGLYLSFDNENATTFPCKKFGIISLSSLLLGIVPVVVLFLLSEDIIHRHNNFVRRFPHHPITLEHQKDLGLNSYYLAGIDHENIYLGNVTAPLFIKALDFNLVKKFDTEIKLSKMDLPFRTPRIYVGSSMSYFIDGTIPVIFSGNKTDWKTEQHRTNAFFSLAVPIDSVTFAIRARDSKTNENVLGLLKISPPFTVRLSKDVLIKQLDGVFDTDGMLLYNEQLNKILYTYYYRNQFIVSDPQLEQKVIGKTIDTISKAQLKVSYISSKKTKTIAAPPLVVNKATATYGNYLFVHSGLMGRFEPEDTWKRSSVIDVYDLVKNTYAFSFYVPNRDKDKLSEFRVYQNRLIAQMGNYIMSYRLDTKLFDSSITK